MQTRKLLKVGLMLAATALLAGCKLEVISVQGGDIAWDGGSCPEGSNCVIDITDPKFSKTFTVTPKEGYRFVKWRRGNFFLCGDLSRRNCTFTMPADEKLANAIIALYQTGYLLPVYENVGLDPDKDGLRNEIDEDDDGDSIFDVDDNCENTPLLVAVDTFGCPIP